MKWSIRFPISQPTSHDADRGKERKDEKVGREGGNRTSTVCSLMTFARRLSNKMKCNKCRNMPHNINDIAPLKCHVSRILVNLRLLLFASILLFARAQMTTVSPGDSLEQRAHPKEITINYFDLFWILFHLFIGVCLRVWQNRRQCVGNNHRRRQRRVFLFAKYGLGLRDCSGVFAYTRNTFVANYCPPGNT